MFFVSGILSVFFAPTSARNLVPTTVRVVFCPAFQGCILYQVFYPGMFLYRARLSGRCFLLFACVSAVFFLMFPLFILFCRLFPYVSAFRPLPSPFFLRFRLPPSAVAFFLTFSLAVLCRRLFSRLCFGQKKITKFMFRSKIKKSRRLPVFAPLSFFGCPRALFSPSRRLQTVDYPHALSKKLRLYRSPPEKQAKIPESRANPSRDFHRVQGKQPRTLPGLSSFFRFFVLLSAVFMASVRERKDLGIVFVPIFCRAVIFRAADVNLRHIRAD